MSLNNVNNMNNMKGIDAIKLLQFGMKPGAKRAQQVNVDMTKNGSIFNMVAGKNVGGIQKPGAPQTTNNANNAQNVNTSQSASGTKQAGGAKSIFGALNAVFSTNNNNKVVMGDSQKTGHSHSAHNHRAEQKKEGDQSTDFSNWDFSNLTDKSASELESAYTQLGTMKKNGKISAEFYQKANKWQSAVRQEQTKRASNMGLSNQNKSSVINASDGGSETTRDGVGFEGLNNKTSYSALMNNYKVLTKNMSAGTKNAKKATASTKNEISNQRNLTSLTRAENQSVQQKNAQIDGENTAYDSRMHKLKSSQAKNAKKMAQTRRKAKRQAKLAQKMAKEVNKITAKASSQAASEIQSSSKSGMTAGAVKSGGGVQSKAIKSASAKIKGKTSAFKAKSNSAKKLMARSAKLGKKGGKIAGSLKQLNSTFTAKNNMNAASLKASAAATNTISGGADDGEKQSQWAKWTGMATSTAGALTSAAGAIMIAVGTCMKSKIVTATPGAALLKKGTITTAVGAGGSAAGAALSMVGQSLSDKSGDTKNAAMQTQASIGKAMGSNNLGRSSALRGQKAHSSMMKKNDKSSRSLGKAKSSINKQIGKGKKSIAKAKKGMRTHSSKMVQGSSMKMGAKGAMGAKSMTGMSKAGMSSPLGWAMAMNNQNSQIANQTGARQPGQEIDQLQKKRF